MKTTDLLYYQSKIAVTGKNSLTQIKKLIPDEGNILLITSNGFEKRGIVKQIIDLIQQKNIHIYSGVNPNPDNTQINKLITKYHNLNIKCLIALGGGSVIDTAKVLSVYLKLKKYISTDQKIQIDTTPIYLIAIPTTSGSGSEITPYATIWDKKKQVKYSIESSKIIPKKVIIDPNLTISLNKENSLYSALDAISHSLDSLWNKNITNESKIHSLNALKILTINLPIILKNPNDLEARYQMQIGSYVAAMAICITKTSLAHTISYPLTLKFNVPHGLACSFTLIEIIKINRSYLNEISGHENNLFQNVINLLKNLNLPSEIKKFVSFEQIKSMKTDCFKNGRLSNYYSNEELNISEILINSLNDI